VLKVEFCESTGIAPGGWVGTARR